MTSHGSLISSSAFVLRQLVPFVCVFRVTSFTIELAHLVLEDLALLLLLVQSFVKHGAVFPIVLIKLVFLLFQRLCLLLNNLDLRV